MSSGRHTLFSQRVFDLSPESIHINRARCGGQMLVRGMLPSFHIWPHVVIETIPHSRLGNRLLLPLNP